MTIRSVSTEVATRRSCPVHPPSAYDVAMSSPSVWHEFALDPRDPAHAGLRAADADRDVVRRVLGDAYAEGKLDREEFDERTDVVATSRTLGQLPAIIDDLVP